MGNTFRNRFGGPPGSGVVSVTAAQPPRDVLHSARGGALLREIGPALAFLALFIATFTAARWALGVLVPGAAF